MAEVQPTRSAQVPAPTTAPSPDDPTIGKLVADLSKDVSSLVSKEIELAKSELKVNLRFSGMAAALFAVAAFLLLIAIVILSVAAGFFLHFTGLDLAWCFLIVFGAYVLVALLLALFGYRAVRKMRATVKMPRTVEQLGKTKDVLKRP